MQPACLLCRHLRPSPGLVSKNGPFILYCDAFPEGGSGVPAEIIDGELDHSEEYPGDGGIRFEFRPPLSREGNP